MVRPKDLEVITFDCYGTLIDWETGIQRAFKQSLENLGLNKSQEVRLFDLYEREEARIELERPYRPYRKVLAEAFAAAAQAIGKAIPVEATETLAKQLPTWPPFPDTNPTLEKLKTRYKLGILSNVDNDLLNGTLKNLSIRFDFLVTAEEVQSYKPQLKHFIKAKKIVGDRGWLHVAASLYHDIEPASSLGIESVWVNRKNLTDRKGSPKARKEVRNLTELAIWLTP